MPLNEADLKSGHGLRSADMINHMIKVGMIKVGMETVGMEKRKNLRLPMRLYGQFSLDDGEYHQTETRDIGLRGALVKHAANGAVDRNCVLTLFAGDTRLFSVTFDGCVVYEDERGCGVEFQSTDAKDFEAFKAFIQDQAPDPQILHREIASGQIPRLNDWNLF